MVVHVLDYGFRNRDWHTVSGAFHVLHRERAFAHVWPQIASRRDFIKLTREHFASSRQFGWDDDGNLHAFAHYYGVNWWQFQYHDWIYIPMVNLSEAAYALAVMFGIRCRICSEVKPPISYPEFYHSAVEFYAPVPFKPPKRPERVWPLWLVSYIRDMPVVDDRHCKLPLLCWECTDQVIRTTWGRGSWEEQRNRLDNHPSPVLNYALRRLRGEARRQFRIAA